MRKMCHGLRSLCIPRKSRNQKSREVDESVFTDISMLCLSPSMHITTAAFPYLIWVGGVLALESFSGEGRGRPRFAPSEFGRKVQLEAGYVLGARSRMSRTEHRGVRQSQYQKIQSRYRVNTDNSW